MEEEDTLDNITLNATARCPLTGWGSWKYAIRGLVFLAKHRSTWCVILCPLVILGLLYMVVLMLLLAYTIDIQAQLVEGFVEEGLAITLAVMACFVEAQMFLVVVSALIIDSARRDLFDEVFFFENVRHKSLHDFVEFNRSRLGVTFGVNGLLVLLSPIAVLVPMVLVHVGVLGWLFAWSSQTMFLSARGFSFHSQWAWVVSDLQTFISLGSFSLLLEWVPLLNVVFMFSNICGYAFYSASLLKNDRLPPHASSESGALLEDDAKNQLCVNVGEDEELYP